MPAHFLTSRLLTVAHGFSTRAGGVSVAPFDSLNLGLHVGDNPAAVEENLRRLASAAGLEAGIVTVTQVHGDRVLEVTEAPASPNVDVGEADALLATVQGVAVGVRTADCVPVLIEASDTGDVAAAHAGWRGTEAEIVLRTLERLTARGARIERAKVAIGPAIGPCCYEVSLELAERFTAKFGEGVVSHRGTPHLDLVAAIRVTLGRAGLPADRVEALGNCTSCEGERFFSHRRDRGATGRHLSFIQRAGRPFS